MALTPITLDATPDMADIAKALVELQGLKFSVVAGAAAVTNIAVASIGTTDTLRSVIRFHSGVPSDVTSEASITSGGNIQLSTTDTTSDTLIVVWFDKV